MRKFIGLLAILGLASMGIQPALAANTDPAYTQIGADSAWSQGFTGKGAVIAILEQGVDIDHPYFKDSVIDGYCIITDPNPNLLCPNGKKEMSGLAAAQRPAGDFGHGLGVASAAAGNPNSGGPGGVARDAKIIMVRADGGDPAIMAALEHLIEMKKTLNIVAVNMSFGRTSIGTRENVGDCDSHLALRSFRSTFKRVRAAGIVLFGAAGNAPTRNDNISTFPACVSEVVAVGSTNNQRQIETYVTASEKVELFAPDFPQVLRNGGMFGLMGGTSTATPVAAGAFAILRQGFPNKTDTEIISAMSKTGKPIADLWLKNKTEIDLNSAIIFLSTGVQSSPTPTESPKPSATPTPSPTAQPPVVEVCQPTLEKFVARTVKTDTAIEIKLAGGCGVEATAIVNGKPVWGWHGDELTFVKLPTGEIKNIKIISGTRTLKEVDYTKCSVKLAVVGLKPGSGRTTMDSNCAGLGEVTINGLRTWIVPLSSFPLSYTFVRPKGGTIKFFFMGRLLAVLNDSGLKRF